MTEPAKPELPWDEDGPERELLARAIQVGVPVDAILDTLGHRTYNGRRILARDDLSRRDIDKLERLILRHDPSALDKPETPEDAPVLLATPAQVGYILRLLRGRAADGDTSGFRTGPTDRAGIEQMTSREASAYIDSLKGNY